MAGKIAIAVDFGTTYSAIGYAHIENGVDPADAVLTVVDVGWPGQGRRASPKIPTVFKGGPNDFKYGFQVHNDPERVCFAKLFLDPNQISKAQHLARFTEAPDIYAPEILTQGLTRFLSCLRRRALDHMIQEKRWTQNFVNRTPKEYILSVPAIWSDRAKDRTLQCAFDAGFGIRGDSSSIRLVSEPEAAALYTITVVPNRALEVDDVFVVCDAGGGTVDLATYRIKKLQPVRQVEEAAVSHGDLCGSVMLNRRFLEFVERKTGPLTPEFMQEVEKDFNEKIKPEYNGDDTRFSVDVDPDTADNAAEGLENGRLAVTGDDLKLVFDPVIDRVLSLLLEQVEAAAEMRNGRRIPILLVGGFGSSEYLKARVVQSFPDCTVIQPPDAWSAVVRGSLMGSMIKKRKIRSAYGVEHSMAWSATHENGGIYASYLPGDYKYYDRYEEKWMCGKHMRWYVKKGDEFPVSQGIDVPVAQRDELSPKKFPFYTTVGIYHNFRFEINLYTYLGGREGDNGPPFKDGDCLRIAVLKPDLSEIPKSSFPKHRSSKTGDHYYKINYTLEMSFDDRISFRLRHNGVSYGEVEAEYVDPTHDAGVGRQN